MKLLTIGAFARAAGLSPKALRLYDELGLLPPAAVDAENGYRFYDPGQLERARFIASLRRLDMPLALIRRICQLPPEDAAAEVGRYWARVAADTAAREQLAALLVGRLAAQADASGPAPELSLRAAARSAVGLVRDTDEDLAYAGTRLLAVADGMRGTAGALAAEAAVAALHRLETRPDDDPLLDSLAAAFADADAAVRSVAGRAHGHRDTARGDGGRAVTTLTALLWTGSHTGLAHVGDTRAYLLRDGGLRQLTDDHSWVRGQVDLGRLSHEEAAVHPRRSLLTAALDGGGTRPELALHPAAAGDRYLLCTDGLWSVVATATLRTVLCGCAEPGQAADELVAAAYAAGAPDNVACVVADVTAS
ncbi:MerR family transcriptional regulator [Catellatospora citrea]|uniref:MerR family transcriptional regulator n=1 Tax=Catellatospora citrea TaxID=53366 RepID=UPI000FF192FE|nr:MerR family transcriptional regulator [Catellatospora citrea]RKE02854.1 protein phosphatase [Catellatospora citrea]